MKKSKYAWLRWPALPALVMCIAFFILNIFVTQGFLQSYVILGFLSSNIPLLCVSVGCAGVIIAGGMDISLGAIISLVNVIFVKLSETGMSLAAQITVCLLLSLLMGLLNGIIIGWWRVTPLLATYATSSVYAGISLWLLPRPGGIIAREFTMWYNSFLFGVIPVPVLFAVLILALWAVLMKSPLRYWLYSSGRDGAKAYVSGVPVYRTQVFSYVFAGLTAGIGGIALSGSTQGGDATVGLSLSMNAIAACVIGGISLAGGIGAIIGSMFGALFLSLVTMTVLSAHVSSLYQSLIKGIILLAGVLFSLLIERRILKERKQAGPPGGNIEKDNGKEAA